MCSLMDSVAYDCSLFSAQTHLLFRLFYFLVYVGYWIKENVLLQGFKHGCI